MNEYNTGMGTTSSMWGILSELLAEYDEKLPNSLNEAIYALCDGRAVVKFIVEIDTTSKKRLKDEYQVVNCSKIK